MAFDFVPRYGKVTPLNASEIKAVSDEIVYGNYQFGVIKDEEFVPKYIGRSDSGLKKEIRQHLSSRCPGWNGL